MFFHGWQVDDCGGLEVFYGPTPVPNDLYPSRSHCIIAKGGDELNDVVDAFCEVGDESDEAQITIGGKWEN